MGYLFLEAPPAEEVPIADFRTTKNRRVSPSPELLDSLHLAQLQQDWYHEYAIRQQFDPVSFVGSVSLDVPEPVVADLIRQAVGFDMARRVTFSSWDDARRRLVDAIEDLGVLVQLSSYAGANTRRTLDPEEFRGFALSDKFAPLIFVNTADSLAAQIFTMIHELVHIWLGESALSDASMNRKSLHEHELWANRVAAEVLVPRATITREYSGYTSTEEFARLARLFKVSTLVILKSLQQSGLLTWTEFQAAYEQESARVAEILAARKSGRSGGSYYSSQPLKISRSLARAVVTDTREGKTLYRDAYRLLGAAKAKTFDHFAETLGVA